jgi:hypothetical protein
MKDLPKLLVAHSGLASGNIWTHLAPESIAAVASSAISLKYRLSYRGGLTVSRRCKKNKDGK